jgi:two-component sensor histidine kinase
MDISVYLQPAYLLQTIVLALSIFNLVAFLWLACTVWLNGDRKAGIARLGVIGLGLSALFFVIHALLIATPLTRPSGLVSQDFLWRLLWIPALGVPYIWFAIGLYYAALINQKWRKRRYYLLVLGGALGAMILALLIFNASTFSYAEALRAIGYGNDAGDYVSGLLSLPVLLSLLFLVYVTFCAIAPWFTISRIARLLRVFWQYLARRSVAISTLRALKHALVDAFWDDPRDLESLDEPHLSWHLARPGLLLAALLMVGLTTSLGVLIIQSIVGLLRQSTMAGAAPPNNAAMTTSLFPMRLIILDLGAMVAIALVILLIGNSILRHGILIERSLARRGFLEQWRGVVIMATALAIFIALLVTQTHSNLGGLLIITSLATGAYALFTWSNYTAHDRYIALLGPFVRSASLRHWLNTDLEKTERDLEALFVHLCRDVLAVQCAYLDVLVGSIRRSFSYRWSADALPGAMVAAIIEKRRSERRKGQSAGGHEGRESQARKAKGGDEDSMPGFVHDTDAAPSRLPVVVNGVPMICWILPIRDERGLVATLYLGPRKDGSAFTDEDMNLAHACGQRILDTLGDHEAMQAVAGLLRRRIVDVKLLGAQQRRVLHDEILPQIHLALLRLETLHSQPRSGVSSDATDVSPEAGKGEQEQAIEETIDLISSTHRRLAAMMRETAPGAPYRLERDGMLAAIRAMLEQDFQHAFDEVEWRVSEETAAYIDEITPPAIAELVFAAVQEALRNAARHARGADVHRPLRLLFKASWNAAENCLEVIVADDGVGTGSASTTTGTGGGLLTHSALLAIAGGNLSVKSSPGEGVTVRILLPAGSLR